MNISEIESGLKVRNSPNNLDKQLHPKLAKELPNYSGFCIVISGSSGSGKTTLLYSLMTGTSRDGIKRGYKRVFDKIYIVSPTIANNSIKNDPFNTIPENQVYRELTSESLDEIKQNLEENRENDLNSCLILDDVGSEIKRSKQVEKKLTSLIQNRRHLYTSIIILLQKFRDAPTGIRNNMSHFISFRPKNMIEREAIASELFNFKKDELDKIMDYVFNDRHSFLYVDLSLKNDGNYIYHKNFNRLQLN